MFRMLTLKYLPIPSLEEECESSLCTSALRARNLELSQDMKKMTAVFEKLQTYVSLLALPSEYVCHSWFNLKNLENKKPEEGDMSQMWAGVREPSIGSGIRKTQIQVLQPLTHLWSWGKSPYFPVPVFPFIKWWLKKWLLS